MKVLSLDISSVSTGWCILNDLTLVDYGIIKLYKALDTAEKLRLFRLELVRILLHYSPDVVVIEDTFFQKNVKTLKLLSYFVGVAMEAAYSEGSSLVFLAVQTVRSFFKVSSKKEIFNIIYKYFRLKGSFKTLNDITDSIANALTFIGKYEEVEWEDLRKSIK